MDRRVFTISQINRYIRSVLDDDMVLNNIFIEGEITGFKAHPSGHLYFMLKDSNAQINCVMFRSSADTLKFTPENGMKTIVLGRVSAYEKTGQYQIYAEAMEPAGVGALHLAFEQLKQKLYNEGLFDSARKQPLPAYPRCIAVVTAGSGAAVQDIITVITRRNKTIKIVIVPTAVQGERAPDEIAAALRAVNAWGQADCIIVGRGGGSMEDLQAFNDERVARAVAASAIPVVSAVGHETDTTIADYVADLRAPTPSAAAEMVTPLLSGMKEMLYDLFNELYTAMADKINELKQTVAALENSPALASPLAVINDKRAYITTLVKRMDREITHRLNNARMDVDNRIELLNTLAPDNILKRGYAYVYAGKRVISSGAVLSAGQKIKIRFFDCDVNAVVEGNPNG